MSHHADPEIEAALALARKARHHALILLARHLLLALITVGLAYGGRLAAAAGSADWTVLLFTASLGGAICLFLNN